MQYDFKQQLTKGQRYEAELDDMFAPGFEISPATAEEQREGIDRHYVHRQSGTRYDVEYKADETAQRTHNAFVETISVDTVNKPGWAYTSKAQYLLYYIPGENGTLYIIRFERLRHYLRRWVRQYPTKRIPNKGYHTIGLIVPLDEFEKCSEVVL